VLEKCPKIVPRLTGMLARSSTMFDRVDVALLPDGLLDELARPAKIGATRVGGIDVHTTRIRAMLDAVQALTEGFTVAQLAIRVQTMTGQTDHE
jgi:hypothetical protein